MKVDDFFYISVPFSLINHTQNDGAANANSFWPNLLSNRINWTSLFQILWLLGVYF